MWELEIHDILNIFPQAPTCWVLYDEIFRVIPLDDLNGIESTKLPIYPFHKLTVILIIYIGFLVVRGVPNRKHARLPLWSKEAI